MKDPSFAPQVAGAISVLLASGCSLFPQPAKGGGEACDAAAFHAAMAREALQGAVVVETPYARRSVEDADYRTLYQVGFLWGLIGVVIPSSHGSSEACNRGFADGQREGIARFDRLQTEFGFSPFRK